MNKGKSLYHIIMDNEHSRHTLSTRASTFEKGVRRARDEAYAYMADCNLGEGYKMVQNNTGATIYFVDDSGKDEYIASFYIQEKETLDKHTEV